MMFLMRILEALLAGGMIVAALSVWRLCSPSSSRRLRVLGWVVAAAAACGVVGFYWAAALKVSLRIALGGDVLVNAASPVLLAAIVSGIIVLAGGWVLSFIRLGIPRFRDGSTSNLKYEAVSLTVCVALLVTSLELPVQNPRLFTPEQRITQLDRSLRALEDGDREMPRDTWDPDHVVTMVGRDPQRLFRWVQQNTYWIPYHGVLRGPVGVLMDRQGNSLDRAILLATLLQKAGYTVRLAHGELTVQQALENLPGLVAERAVGFNQPPHLLQPDSPVRVVATQYQLDGSAIEGTLNGYSDRVTRLSLEMQQRVARQTERLLRTLNRPFVNEQWTEQSQGAVEALRDHWWVQIQDRDGRDLDLLSGDGQSALVPAREAVNLADVQAGRSHEIEVRVVTEHWRDGASITRTVLRHKLRPAELIGQPIVLQFWPSDWPSDFRPPGEDRRKAVRVGSLQQHEWRATLLVGPNVAEKAVVTEALHLASDRNSTPGAGGNPLGGLGGAISNALAPEKASGELSAVWLEYELLRPGTSSQTIRRTIFDLLGPAARARNASPQLPLTESSRLVRSLSLMMRTEILPVVCRIAPEYVMHLLSESVAANHEVMQSAIKGELNDVSAAIQALSSKSVAGPSPLYNLALARFDLSRVAQHVYVNQPIILTRHVFPMWGGDHADVRDTSDIVANATGVDLLNHDPFATRVEQGVLDTNAERLAIGTGQIETDTSEAFDSSSDWSAIASDSNLSTATLEKDVQAQIASDLHTGYTAVALRKPLARDGEAFSGWWRVDAKTGDTLGVSARGWGEASAIRTFPLSAVALFTSATERSLLWQVAERWAYGFAFDYGVCLAMAEGSNIIENLASGRQLAPFGQSAYESRKVCGVMAIITSGLFATLPFLTMYLAARVGIAGGWRVGFTLWLRGLRADLRALAADTRGGYRFPGTYEPPPRGAGPHEPPPSKGSPKGSPKGGPHGPNEPGGQPNEPGGGSQNEANPPDAKPSSDDPCQGTEEASPNADSMNNESPGSAPEEPTPGVPEVPTAADVEAARQAALAAKQDYKSASQVSSEDVGEYVRYTLRIENRVGPAPNENGDYWPPGPPVPKKWPNEPGPQDYDPNFADELSKKADSAMAQSWKAMRRLDELWDQYAAIDKKYLETHGQTSPKPVGADGNCGTPYVQPSQTLGLGPGNTQPLGPGVPSPIGPPIGPPAGSPPGSNGLPAGPGQTQPLSPGGPPPGTSPPGSVDPYAKTVAGLAGAGNAMGKP
jgi:hypothetical protein